MNLKHKNIRRITWLLSFILYAQALFPVQAHTRLVQNADGQLVTICTLQGNTQVQLDEPLVPTQQQAPNHNAGYTAAVAFSMVIGQALMATLPVIPYTTPIPVSEPVLHEYRVPQTFVIGPAYPRGPPVYF